MTQTIKTRSGRVLVLPTPAEDARIRAGIAADPDTYEVSDEEFKLMRRPGRPLGSGTKTQITLRAYSGERDRWVVLRRLILCRRAFLAGFPLQVLGFF